MAVFYDHSLRIRKGYFLHTSSPQFDFTALSPAERMDLADWLYDSAVEELVAGQAPLSDAQAAEVEHRLAALDLGTMTTVPWEQVYKRLISV